MMHSADDTRHIVTRFWALMQTNDWDAAAALFDEGYVLHWPQSGERIVGRANFVAVNASYPAAGRWQFTLEQLVVEGELAVSDVVVTDGAITGRAITFSTVQDGRILRQVEYWPDPFDAPAWRAAWVQRDERDGRHPALCPQDDSDQNGAARGTDLDRLRAGESW